MKRAIRTLRRLGVTPELVRYVGGTHNGKHVVRRERLQRAQHRLMGLVPPQIVNALVNGLTLRQSVKELTKFSRSPSVVQDAIIEAGTVTRGCAKSGLSQIFF